MTHLVIISEPLNRAACIKIRALCVNHTLTFNGAAWKDHCFLSQTKSGNSFSLSFTNTKAVTPLEFINVIKREAKCGVVLVWCGVKTRCNIF